MYLYISGKVQYSTVLCIFCFVMCVFRLMSGMEDLLFYTITDGREMIPMSQFISVSQHSQHAHIACAASVWLSVMDILHLYTNTATTCAS